ncbi:stealth family protein [Streptomyces sp. NPDC035033]|uniref:stealth family protein n=1 Tax=Streptomyces sp. NPDC035033 TaxID=3155368 RepID=UPI0033D37D38
MRNPEAPRLLGVYRRAVPERVRRVVVAQLDADVRRRVKLRIASGTAAAERLRQGRLARRYAALTAGPDRAVISVGRAPKVALVAEGITPLRARRANLEAVLGALAAAGVPHFCVPGTSDTSSAVAVRERDRSAVLTALADACAREPGYVAPAGGNRPAGRGSQPGFAAGTWHRLRTASVLRLVWYRADPTHQLKLGDPYGCDVEFWREEGDELTAPRPGRVTASLPREGRVVEAPESCFTDFTDVRPGAGTSPAGAPLVPARAETAVVRSDQVTFPVDVVYTWVDGSDPEWLRRRAEYSGEGYHAEAANPARYLSRDELRYSLRSLHLYAPWVRNIFLVTDDQTPAWLDTTVPGLRVVSHKEIFRSPELLPTFNSHAIESQLHHIDGLAEHFLYLNDDVMLSREVTPRDFFHASGLTKFFPSPALVPLGERSLDDPPVAAAGKNNRRLIEERYGAVLVQKMKHMPHPLRRSVLAEIETEFAVEYGRTEANRFRSVDDISIASSLHHYYAFHTGRAVPSTDLPYAYLDLTHPWTETRLGRLLARRDRAVFCVNDTVSTERDADGQKDLITPFLEAYFPVPSPYEKR